MNISSIKSALVAWIASSTGVSGSTVYWGEPNAPRPPNPAVRLKLIIGPGQVGLDELRPAEGDNFQITGPRTFTLSLTAYGADAHQIIANLQTSVSNPTPMAALAAAAKVSVLGTAPARDLSSLIVTKFEQRVQMDVDLLATEDVLVELDTIESVEGSSVIGGIEDELEVNA